MSENKQNKLRVAYSRIIDAIHYVAEQDDIALDDTAFIEKLTEATMQKIRRFITIDACGIYLINEEEFTFDREQAYPEEHAEVLDSNMDACQEEGTFSWALNQNRAIVLHGEEDVSSKILHVIASRERVIGMFIAVYHENTSDIDEVSLALLGITLGNYASKLETFRLQVELRQQNEQLEAKVQERTEALEEESLKAVAASKAKSEFLTMMSHEIRTPMNGVMGMAQVLAMTNLNDDQKKQLDMVIESGNNLTNIINDILDYSKIEAGKLDIIDESFDLQTLITKSVELFRDKANEKELELKTEVSPKSPVNLIGDRNRIRQIFANLINNALKFTIEGRITVKVDVTEKDQNSANFIFRVIDTGVGINKEILPKLFTDFTQADKFTTRNYGGTGLGLAICKRLVELMGGQIGVESSPGKGSTFWFELKLELQQELENEIPDLTNTTSNNVNEQVNMNVHILLVEDNMVNQMVACGMLDSTGATYEVAENGEVAVQKYLENKYDLILMDCQMPVMDGRTATKIIREKEAENGRYTPIIALSADANADSIDLNFESGMDDFLSKPVLAKDLNEKIAKWTQQDKGIKQAST